MHSLVTYRDEASGPVMLWKYGSWEEWGSREGKREMFELQYDWPWRKLLAFGAGGGGGGAGRDAQPGVELTQSKYCSLPTEASLRGGPQALPSLYPHPCVMPPHFVPGWACVTGNM